MNLNMDKLENLLAEKNYQDLLPDEKAWVNQEYSADEYNAMRLALLESKSMFQAERTRPNPEIQSRLRQKLKQDKEPAVITPLFSYRIPAWQAIAAFALLLFFIPQVQDKNSSDPEKVFIYQTDTVYKEVPFESIISPIVDTVTSIPKIKKILKRTNRSPIKASTVVFSHDQALSAGLSRDLSLQQFSNNYDTASVENIISRYLKDSVKSYRIDIDTGFQDLGRVY